MRQLVRWMVLIGLVIACSAGVASAATMYAKKNGVTVTAEKSPMSDVMATLKRGDSVEVLSESGRHAKVRTRSGKVGWVFKFKLSKEKISGSGGGDALSALTGESRIEAKETRAGGSIRGLEEASEAYSENKRIDPAHKHSVERMEQLVIPRDELLEFQQKGEIGEFVGGGQ